MKRIKDVGRKIRRIMREKNISLENFHSRVEVITGKQIYISRAKQMIRVKRLSGKNLMLMSRILEVSPNELAGKVKAAFAEIGLNLVQGGRLMGMTKANTCQLANRVETGGGINNASLKKLSKATGKPIEYFIN